MATHGNLSLSLSSWLRNFTASRLVLSYAVFLFVALVLPVMLGTMLVSSDTHAGTDIAGNTSGYYVSVTSADSLNLSVNAVPGGAVASTSDTLSVSSNTPNGYKVYISTPSNATGSNYLCPAGVTPSTSACFVPTTAAASLLDLTTNSWGYSLDGTSYSPVPLYGSGVAIINKTSSTSESGVSKNIHFGIKADMALPSDTYTGTIMYTALADTSGTTSQTTISPTSTENIGGGDTLTVTIPYISSRPEAEIKNATSITIGDTSCPLQSITQITSPYTGIQATCTMPAKAAGTYTVSVSISQAGGSQQYTASSQMEYILVNNLIKLTSMQDLANHPDYCTTSGVGAEATLSDTRDSQQYRVFKAKDGNCWMGENLRYGATTGGAARAYNSADAAKSNNMNTTNMANLTTSRICTTSSGCKTPGNVNMFSGSGDNYTMPYILIYQANTTADYDGKTKYGVMYNYCAVTGGTVCTASYTDYNPTGSICPKGWKLPGMTASATGTGAVTDGSVKTYNNLANSYGYGNTQAGMNGMFSSPINLLRAGYASSGSLVLRYSGGLGYYWSSTKATSTSRAYTMYFYEFSGNYVEQGSSDRDSGFSARCVSGS